MNELRAADELGHAFTEVLGEDAPLRIEFWDGSTLGADDAKARVILRSPNALRRIIWAPGELGWARAFIAGDIDLEGDIYIALEFLLKGNPGRASAGTRTVANTLRSARKLGAIGLPLPTPPEETVPKGRRHSRRRDATAIAHHYDVGNDFYRLVLGETMTYSCARFEEPDQTLDDAQRSKYDLVCRKLGLKPGMRLLDVGCGWGGLLIHAAENYGVEAVGITLSVQQAHLARERVKASTAAGLVDIRVQDYRDLHNETFDAISSVGMFEHVGRARMAQYFATLYSVLGEGGRLLNHAIDKPYGSVMEADGFIARYVFPDGELQDIATSAAAMQDAGFEVRDIESLREHYAKTLRLWVTNLENNWTEAVAIAGPNRTRVWWAYMAGSAVGFESNRISVHQTLAVKTGSDGESGMPPTRRSFV